MLAPNSDDYYSVPTGNARGDATNRERRHARPRDSATQKRKQPQQRDRKQHPQHGRRRMRFSG